MIKKALQILGLQQNATLKEPEWWRQMLAINSSTAGVNVTIDTALRISAVYACVRILSETIASLPVKVYEATQDGRKEIIDHPLKFVLGTVSNEEQTAYELRQFFCTNLLLHGNAYCQKVVSRGVIRELVPLYSRHMYVDRTPEGKLVFDYQETGNAKVFNARDLWRTSGLSLNGVTGLSPIGYQRESLGLTSALDQQAARQFSNGAKIPGVLEFPEVLSDDQIERIKKQFEDSYSGSENSWKTLILESGMKYTAVGMNNQDAQFIEIRKAQIAEIARWYGVPLHRLAELDKATFSNIEHQSIEFVRDTLRPWLVNIEQTIARDILTARERQTIFVSHVVEGLLRGDIKSRFEAYGKAINDGWMSRNEVRVLENRNKEDGLDEFLVPMNMSDANQTEEQDENSEDEENQDQNQRAINDNIVNYIVNREMGALKREAHDKTPEEFKAWVPNYYNKRHKKFIEELLGPSEKIDNYIETRVQVLSTTPEDSLPAVLTKLPYDIGDLLK